MKNIILIIIGFLLFIGASIYCDVNNKDVYVNGTVIAKSEEITTHHKLIKVTTDYILSIHPDNSEKYVDFDYNVPLSTYVKYDVGDKISCKKEAYYILKDPKWYDDKSTLCIIYVFIKLCGMALIILGYFAIIKNLNHKLLFN